MTAARIRSPGPGRRREDGIVLIMVLIGVVAMMLAGIALMRGAQTGSMIAGNFAFRQASLAANDTAVELALAQLGTIVPAFADQPFPGGCSGTNCVYYPTRQPTDINGIPTTVGDWSSVPVNVLNGSYSTQYVIDRLCVGPLPIANPSVNCFVGTASGAGGSRKIGDVAFASMPQVFYRISVRVRGPRNTVNLTQAIVAK